MITPDRNPGELKEDEGLDLMVHPDIVDPTGEGQVRYVSGVGFRAKDKDGVFNMHPVPSSGSGILATCVIGSANNPTVDVYSNSATWGGLVLSSSNLTVTHLQVWVYQQGATGYVQGGIYDADTNALLGVTTQVDATTTGLKRLDMESPVDVTSGYPYYLAVSCTSNGARLVGSDGAPSSFNLNPKPAFYSFNARLPATLSPSASGTLVWIGAFA